jgi:hypothetical protein
MTSEAIFDDKQNLWITITDGKIPPWLMVEQTALFMVEHDAPGRVMFNLTAYIALCIEQQRRP